MRLTATARSESDSVTGGLLTVFSGLKRKRELRTAIASGGFIAGWMIVGAASVFPIMLHSMFTPEYSLSAYQNAAARHGLSIALVWWPASLIFAVGYFLFHLSALHRQGQNVG